MNWKLAAAATACLALSVMKPALAQHHHWGYSGEAAPQNWGKLDPEFATCASGKSQSPIDVGKSLIDCGESLVVRLAQRVDLRRNCLERLRHRIVAHLNIVLQTTCRPQFTANSLRTRETAI